MVRGPKKIFEDQVRLPITRALKRAVDAVVIGTDESRGAFIRAAIEEKIAAQDEVISGILSQGGANLDATIEAEIKRRERAK